MNVQFEYQDMKGSYFKTGNGYPIMFIHGFGEDYSVWKPVINKIKGNITSIIPELPGCGNCSLPAGKLTISYMAKYIKHIVELEKTGPLILMGHSMGGYITMAFAEKYSTYLSGIGMIHSHPFEDDEIKKKARKTSAEAIRKNGHTSFIDEIIPGYFAPNFIQKYPEIIDTTKEKAKQIDGNTYIAYLEAMADRPDRSVALKKVPCPVLFTIGKEDPVIPLHLSLKQTHLPNTSLIHIFEKTGHMGMLEATEDLASAIDEFLITFIKL